MKRFITLQNLLREAEDEAAKFYNHGNKSAGTRARVALQKVKDLAQIIRMDIQEKKKKA